ncbi:MAG: ATP-binding cassette domain-containing protein [Chloroflexi bacterium]|jgi:energy-coupling factor transport system ATP-binding protein|nr:ATP-binding cassette domain-containing protein [Chloroflexota bacterium]
MDIDLKFEQVTFAYEPEVVALRDINLFIGSGETLAIVGENGAGKSTLVKHLNGLLQPNQGRILVGGWDTRHHTVAQLAHRVGLAFQNPDEQLFKRTVEAEVAFGPKNLGFDRELIKQVVDEALNMVGLGEEAQTHPHDLHSSRKRLVALAATAAMRTPVVILDEPTMGQDAHGVQRVSEIVSVLRDEGRTVIAISHDIDFCADNFDRVVVMAKGQIILDGTPDTVFAELDLLAETQVEPPQLTRLAAALDLPGTPTNLHSFLDRLAEQRGTEV